MEAYFTTVVRTAPQPESGELVRVDLETGEVQAERPIYARDPILPDPNPRGNTRGGRGIVVREEEVVAATYHSLRVYDRDLEPKGRWTHDLFVGLHETEATDDGVWVTSTAIDAALLVDLEEREVLRTVWPREMPGFQEELGLEPLEIDKDADNRDKWLDRDDSEHHLHLNTVTTHQGRPLALFNSHGVVADLDAGEVVLQDQALEGAHNIAVREDGTLALCVSKDAAIRIYDPDGGALVREIDLARFPEVRDLVRWKLPLHRFRWILHDLGVADPPPAKPLFVRGLSAADGRLFVGVAPATILVVDPASGELVTRYTHRHAVKHAVHGLEDED